MGFEPFVPVAHQLIRYACHALESEVYHRVDLLWDKARHELSREQFETALSELAGSKVIEFHGGDTSGMDDIQFEKLIFENGSAHVNITWDDTLFFQNISEKLECQGMPFKISEAEMIAQLQTERDELKAQVSALQQKLNHLGQLRTREKARQSKVIREIRALQAYLKIALD
jgi:hypothetical protein